MAKSFRFNSEDYSLSYKQLVGKYGIDAVRSEYQRMQRNANRRLDTFRKSEFTWTQAYKQHKKGFEKYADIKAMGKSGEKQLMRNMRDLHKFLSSKGGTVRGQQKIRKSTIDTLHERGYTEINSKNYKQWVKFMNEVKAKHYDKMYDSKRMAKAWNEARKKGITTKDVMNNFDAFMGNQEKIKLLDTKPKGASSDWYGEQLKIL